VVISIYRKLNTAIYQGAAFGRKLIMMQSVPDPGLDKRLGPALQPPQMPGGEAGNYRVEDCSR